MHLVALLSLCPLLLATANPLLEIRNNACDENGDKICYGVNGSKGTSQKLDPEDIAYAAAYLRSLADENDNPLWTMPPGTDCQEWKLPVANGGTVLALAKHVSPRVNSSVTYHDIANTIDGGRAPTQAQKTASLLGSCGKNGGQVKVLVNTTNPAYHTASYTKSGAKTEGIIVKLIRDPDYKP